MGLAINWPHILLRDAWTRNVYPTGSTEPWVQQIVAAFFAATPGNVVVELGAYLGHTTLWLATIMESKGPDGVLHAVELDPDRAKAVEGLFHGSEVNIDLRVHNTGAVEFLGSLEDNSVDFAWVDDDHTKKHVAMELDLLLLKVRPGGFILGHDVFGVWDIGELFVERGGAIFDLPQMHQAAWGLGVIQVK